MNKTLITILLATLATSAFAKQYWVTGVNENGGWVDQDKAKNAYYNEYQGKQNVGAGNGTSGYFNNGSDGDGFLCWAASATDILTWWHSQNPSVAQENPAVPHEQGEIWELFKENYVNDSGSADAGIAWYMKGITTDNEPTPRNKNTMNPAGYYPDMLEDSKHFDIRTFDKGWLNPMEYDYTQATSQSDISKNIAGTLANLIEDGYVISLGISGSGGSKHATTLWGVETDDATGLLTTMWITDSDDALNGYGTELIELTCNPVEHECYIIEGHPIGNLRSYGITSIGKEYQEAEFQATKNGRLWYDSYSEGRNDYFYDFTAFKFSTVDYQGVPEPATGTLSLLSLAGLCARRRRK